MTLPQSPLSLPESLAVGAPGSNASRCSRLDDVKKTIWLTRRDLRDFCKDDPDRFECWLLAHGLREYRALSELGYRPPETLTHKPADSASMEVRPVMTRLMKTLWDMRPDLQSAFDLKSSAGQLAFVWWFLIYQVPEFGFERVVTEEQLGILSVPDPRVPGDQIVPITRLMVEIWLRRPDVQRVHPLSTPAGRTGYLCWYFLTGLPEMGLLETVDASQYCALLTEAHNAPGVPRILMMIWGIDPALRERSRTPNSTDLLAWAREDGRKRYPILQRLISMEAATSPAGSVSESAPRRPSITFPFGVNLIGHARGQFGIGEDVRMAALAMQAAGIPFSLYNVEPGREVCQGDDSVDALITDRLPYAVNVLCTTGIETARLAAVEGSRLFDGRRTIGYWPWELPEWPVEWQHAYELVDEVWASSRYTYEAYAKSSPKPVRHVPMTVTVDAMAGLSRRDFRLPEDRFLFVFSFDVLSTLSRKNPQACVRAFKEAFQLGHEPVGLAVKAMRATPDNPIWQELMEEARSDRRITIISETLSRGAVLDLYRACDVFVSLHRAEGFGRGIAEAMMLGKPVIATGYSGNLDFTTPGSAGLVDHKLRPVSPEEYPFAAGQLWAEPDVGHAAWWMRQMAEDHLLRQRLAKQGQQQVLATYAPEVVGAAYRALFVDQNTVPICAHPIQ